MAGVCSDREMRIVLRTKAKGEDGRPVIYLGSIKREYQKVWGEPE